MRLGRAAGEKEVETGSYYSMPDKSFQYCQRFIMQVEESLINRMSKTQVKWDFTRQEKWLWTICVMARSEVVCSV